jgi:ABC-2 type transport system permease protein
MFLLFTCSGAGGALIEEQESGTLERLLLSRLGMARLLLGKWLYLLLLGALQLTVMFVWGALVFGLDLLGHLPGFVIVTVFTAGAAAGFGLLLAAACRTRAQLGGISTIVILVMSAIGGSMFPRFLMPESLQKVGLLTFNGWALDAYLKVFWREQPLPALAPQLAVLLALTLAFLAVTRLLARRWEHV